MVPAIRAKQNMLGTGESPHDAHASRSRVVECEGCLDRLAKRARPGPRSTPSRSRSRPAKSSCACSPRAGTRRREDSERVKNA